ncbi:hypothetical protein ABT317_25040, partial [Streptomyces carpinensis]
MHTAIEKLDNSITDFGLVDAFMPDSVSLGLVVLAAKTNAASMTASVTAGELGRWLGTSAS